MKLPRPTVRLRLIIWYTLILAATMLILSCFVFYLVKSELNHQLSRQLEQNFRALSRLAAEEPDELTESETEMPVPIFELLRNGEIYYQSQTFKRLKFSLTATPLSPGPNSKEAQSRRLPWVGTVSAADGERFRMKIDRLKTNDQADWFLAVAIEEEGLVRVLQTLSAFLFLSSPLALLLAAVGGYFLSGRLLRPISEISAQAERITAENLSARLPVGEGHDELSELARVINRMLERLDDSFERLKRFTADASHELRTPLTVIRSVGEVSLQQPLDSAGYRDVIGSMLEEVDRLTHLVESLLTLTRADSASIKSRLQPVDVPELVETAVEDMRPLAEEKNQELKLEIEEEFGQEKLIDRGGESQSTDLAAGTKQELKAIRTLPLDEELMRLALVNLLDNAIKYTPPGGTITVRVRHRSLSQSTGQAGEKAELLIEVADTGCGIPKEDQPKIFERFYRLSSGKNELSGESGFIRGAGLGLAIADWAIRLNGGRIELESEPGKGSTFRLIFPPTKNQIS